MTKATMKQRLQSAKQKTLSWLLVVGRRCVGVAIRSSFLLHPGPSPLELELELEQELKRVELRGKVRHDDPFMILYRSIRRHLVVVSSFGKIWTMPVKRSSKARRSSLLRIWLGFGKRRRHKSCSSHSHRRCHRTYRWLASRWTDTNWRLRSRPMVRTMMMTIIQTVKHPSILHRNRMMILPMVSKLPPRRTISSSRQIRTLHPLPVMERTSRSRRVIFSSRWPIKTVAMSCRWTSWRVLCWEITSNVSTRTLEKEMSQLLYITNVHDSRTRNFVPLRRSCNDRTSKKMTSTLTRLVSTSSVHLISIKCSSPLH